MHGSGPSGRRGHREHPEAASSSRSSARGNSIGKPARRCRTTTSAGVIAARIMGAIYYDLLRAIERAGYDVFRQHVRVSRPRQALMAGVTWLKVMIPLK